MPQAATPSGQFRLAEPRTHEFTGQHLLLSYEGCTADLNDLEAIERAMREAVEATGAHVRGAASTRFEPQGLSVVLVLSESHASVHTYPEHHAAFLDIFTCGTSCRPEAFDEVMKRALAPSNVSRQQLTR
jgi:S-adenosylmethionine decarboxylase